MGDPQVVAAPAPAQPPVLRFDRAELAGAVADLGVLVPIAVALIVSNGLSATAVLLPAGLLYIAAGLIYRLPIPVQPLKAFGVIAIAEGLGVQEIAAGALLMGVIFLGLGLSGLVDRAARLFPRAVIRGVQLSVGLLFLKLAWGLVADPPAVFRDALPSAWLIPVSGVLIVVAVLGRRHAVTLALVGVAAVVAVLTYSGPWEWGPSSLQAPGLSASALATAAVVLVLPQLPLTFTNSCLATADAAKTYFGAAAARVRPGRLAVTLGAANVLAASIGGMPVCHGAGGLTAHRGFGARTGGAPIALGAALLTLALVAGSSLAGVLTGFPLPILAALLAVAGLLHLTLLRDLRGPGEWALALAIGIAGVLGSLAAAVVAGVALWWAVRAVRAPR